MQHLNITNFLNSEHEEMNNTLKYASLALYDMLLKRLFGSHDEQGVVKRSTSLSFNNDKTLKHHV
jgi:hypothetical protein